MAKYRKKPVIVEAMQWKGNNIITIEQFCPIVIKAMDRRKILHLIIPTLEGNSKAKHNDWIIKGSKGEFYPCKPDIFEQTYEKVED